MVERRRRRQRLRRGNGTGLRPAAEVASEQAGLEPGTGQQTTARTGENLRPAGEVAGEQAAARLRRQQAARNAPLGPYEQALNVGEAQLRSAVPAFKGAVAGSFGYGDYAREQAEEATRIQREAAAEGPPLMQATDVEGWGDVPRFLGQTLLSQGPNIAATAAGAFAGGGVAGLARRGLRRGTTRSARETGREGGEAAARQGLTRTTQAGAAAGAGASETAQITAETFPRLMNDPEAREDHSIADLSRRALGGAAGAGALGVLPAVNVMRRLGLSGAGRQLQQRMARRVAGGAATQAGTEAVTETGQQALMRGIHSTVNENIEVLDDEGLKELFNAGAAGLAVGGATGAAAGLPGGGQARRQRRQGPLGRARERRRAEREAREADETVARQAYENLRERAPEAAAEVAPEGGTPDFSDEDMQRRVHEANLRFSRNVDPRGEMQFDERMDSVAGELIGRFTEEALVLRSSADRLINEQPEGADTTTLRENVDTRRRTAERLDAEMGRIEGTIERLQQAREQGDAEAFINQTFDSIIDGDITLDNRTLDTLSKAFEPFRAQISDMWRLRKAERGGTPTGAASLDMSEINSDRQEDEGEAPNPFQVMSQDEFDAEAEANLDARTPSAMREQETGKVRFIGQSARGGRTEPWVSHESMEKTVPGDRDITPDAAQTRIRRMKEQYGRTDADDTPDSVTTPEGYFERVPFRRVVEAEFLNEQRRREADPNRDLDVEADREELADLEDQLAQGQQAGTLSEGEQNRLVERIDRTRRRIPRGPRPDDPRPVDAEGEPEVDPGSPEPPAVRTRRQPEADQEALDAGRPQTRTDSDPGRVVSEETFTPSGVTTESHAFDDRLNNERIVARVNELVEQTGYADRGGQLIRDVDTGEVTDRTRWIPHDEEVQSIVKGTPWATEKNRSGLQTLVRSALRANESSPGFGSRQERTVRAFIDLAEQRVSEDARQDPLNQALREDEGQQATDPDEEAEIDAIAAREDVDEDAQAQETTREAAEAEGAPAPRSDLDRYLAERGREMQRDLEAADSPRARLYDPEDPAAILDEFVVIRHTETPPQFGQEDPTALTPAELERATHRDRRDLPRESSGRYKREKLRRNEDGELPRGSIAVTERTYFRHGETLDDQIIRMERESRRSNISAERRADLRERINTVLEVQSNTEDAEPGSYVRDENGDRILLNEEEVIYNVQEAANAIRDRLPDREDVQAGSDAREIEVAWEAISSITNQAGKDVELNFEDLRPNTVLMTRAERTDDEGNVLRERREITWREMRRTGAARLRAQLENLKYRQRRGENVDQRIALIEDELRKARRDENRRNTQEDIAAREVLAEPLEYSEEDVQWARDHLQARAEQHAEAMYSESFEPGEERPTRERPDDGVTASVDAERRRVQDRTQRIAEINQRLGETNPDLMGELRNIVAENERLVGELREAGTPIDRLRGLNPEPSAIRSLSAEDNERISLALAELGQRGDELSENHERMQAIEEELNLDPQARELITEREQLREANLEDQARIREQEEAAANVDASPTDQSEQPVNVGEEARRRQDGDSPAGNDEDRRPPRHRQAGDQTFTAVGRARQRMLNAEQVMRRLRSMKPYMTRKGAEVFEEVLEYGTAYPDDLNDMIAEASRARDRYQQQVWDRSVAERREFMDKALRYASVEDARKQFHQIFGERLPPRATVAEIRERVEQASDLGRQARAQPSQLQDEQNMVQTWARRLNITSPETLRVVDRDEIAPLIDEVDMADLMAGAINGVHVRDANGNTLIHARDGLTREARVEVLAHELGHVVYTEHVRNTTEGEAQQMWAAFNKWREARDRPRAEIRTAITTKQALNMAAENLAGMRNYARVRDMGTESRQDLFDFEEWFADNTARWLTLTKEPRTVIERFFKRVADSLKALYEQARKPRNAGGQNLSYRAESSVAGFLRRMWNKAPAQVQSSVEGREAAEQAYEEMPVDNDAIKAVRESLTIEGPIDDDAFIRSIMGAAIDQNADPYSNSASIGFDRAFELLTEAERATLGRFFMRPEIRRQLERLIDDKGTMHSIDNGNVLLAMSEGYKYWMAGDLDPTPRVKSLLQKLYHKLADIFGIVTEHQNAAEVVTALRNGTVAARQQSSARIGDGVVKRFRQQNRLQETAAQAIEGFDLAMKPVRWAFGAQSRIMVQNNPVYSAITQEFQPRPGTERNAQGMYEARNAMRGIFHSRVFSATENLSAEQSEDLLKMLQGDPDAQPLPEGNNVREAYNQIRRLLDDMRKYAVSRGVNMGLIENYWPQVMDLETLETRHSEFINLLSQEKFNDDLQMMYEEWFINKLQTETFGADQAQSLRKLSKEERVAIAESIYDALMKHDGYADTDMEVQDGNNIPALGAAHQRKLAWVMDKGDADDQRQFISFQKQDIGEILAAYTEQIIKRAEWTSRFGNDGSRLEERLQEARQFGATNKDEALMRKYINAMMGTHGRELAPLLQQIATTTGKWFGQDWSNLNPEKFRKLQGVMMVYQNIRVLGLATLTSIADTGGIIVRSNDLGTAMQAFRQGLREITLGIQQHTIGRGRPRSEYQSEMRRLAETMGTIDMHMVNEALGESYGGLYMTGKTRRYNEKFFRFIQLQRWTQFSRIMSLAAGKSFLLKHRDGAYSEHSERFLQQLNLKPEDIRVDEESGDLVVLSEEERRSISDQRAQARAELAEIEEGQAKGDAAALRQEIDDLRDELLRDGRIRTALNRYVDESVMRPNPAQRPIFASHPDAQLLFHLKQFAYAIHNQITRRILTEAGQGNYWPLLAATSYIPIMIAADLLREDIQYGPDGDPRKRHWDAWDYVKDGIHRSGMTGMGTFLLDAHKDRTQFGGVGYESLQGPTVTQMRDIGDYLINGDGEGLSIMADAMPANSLWSNWDMDMTQIEEAPADLQRGTIGSWRN